MARGMECRSFNYIVHDVHSRVANEMGLLILRVDVFIFLYLMSWFFSWCLNTNNWGWLFISDFKFRSINQHLFILWINPILYGKVLSKRSDWFFLGENFAIQTIFCVVSYKLLASQACSRHTGDPYFWTKWIQQGLHDHDMTSGQYSPVEPFHLISKRLNIISVIY